jgi:hypothetical protein
MFPTPPGPTAASLEYIVSHVRSYITIFCEGEKLIKVLVCSR